VHLVLGLDEAGRGPILGPMVLAGVLLRPARSSALRKAGVVDSKKFVGPEAHTRRTELARRIRELADAVEIRVACNLTIDARVAKNQLNHLERELAGDIIRSCPPARRIIADGARMFAPLRAEFAAFESHDRGESVHVAVAAASIVAKAERDALFLAIARRYEPEFGPIKGGGYENAGTRAFLAAYAERHGKLPPETRLSWGGSTRKLQLSLF
jgi:ribonuclease HII